MRVPLLDSNSKPVESPHSNTGSEKGNPTPGGYIRLSDFIQETGRAFYPSSWTGKECKILSDNGYDFWIESPIERLVRRSIQRQTMRLSYIVKGRTPQEARRRIKFDIERAKRLDREGELKDELNKIEGLLIQQQRGPTSFSDVFNEIRLRTRWSEIAEELKEYEGDYFVDDDLPDPSPQDIKDLNDRFATRIERCKAIKERRQVAIIDGLRGALWRGDIPAGHLSRNGEFVPLSCSIWYQEPEWMKAIVCPYIESQRDNEPEWKGERRSILVEYTKAKEWLAHATETEPTADPNKANTTKSGRGRKSTYPGASEYVESFLTRILSAKGREFFEQKNLSSISNLVLDDNQMRKALPTFYNNKDAEGAPLPARMPSGSVIRNWINEWSKGKGVLIGSDTKSKPST
ncbi:MAG: hypothetical protein CMM42_12860 [Rhodospirillaceae bacterium]|nr:hypothetical protein [Rhodospirillaceae bacterium]